MSGGAALALSVLSDAGLAWLLVFRRRGMPLTAPHLLLAAFAGFAFALLKAAAVAFAGRHQFLAIHVVHSFVFLAAPGVGLLVALGWPRRARPAARGTAAFAALLLAAIGIDSSFIEPYALVTETATVAVTPERAGRAELLIGVLSDIQCTEVSDYEREAVARVMAATPDLILLPGDLAQRFSSAEWQELAPSMHELLGTLHAPLGVYAVSGNCDPPEVGRELVRGTEVQLLCDEVVQRSWRDRRVTIAGMDLGVGSARSRSVLEQMSAPGGDDLRIVVAHLPDVALLLPRGGRVDLVVAGHTHGGQVQLPWIGPLITLTSVPREVAAGGLHELSGAPIYVSRGIGHEQGDAPRVRFNCPPEVSLITLRTSEPAVPLR